MRSTFSPWWRAQVGLLLLLGLASSTDGHAPRARTCMARAHRQQPRVVSAMVAPSSGEEDDLVVVGTLLDAVEEWVREQRVQDILPEAKLRSFLAAVRADASFWERQHHQYERLWHRIEAQLRLDTRPVRDVLGAELSDDLVEMLQTYDTSPFVRRAMESPAIERMLGSVLYEALFAFIKSVDILGQALSNLPFFGPMRDQIIAQSKRQLDTMLGGQITSFLGSYTKEAVKSAVRYVDEHPSEFGSAQRTLAESLLDRPFNEALPAPADLALVRDSLWLRLRNLRAPNEDEIITGLYAEFGDETIDTLLPLTNPRVEQVNAPQIYQKSRGIIASNLHGFIASEQGRRFLRQLRELGARDGAQPAGAAVAAPAKPHDVEADDGSTSSADDWD